MLLLKVCGITRSEDAAAACASGFGAIGLVFAESPRRIGPERAREICSGISPSVLRIGVFAGEDGGEVRRIMDYCGLDLVQFHGGEDPGEVLRFGGRAIAALRPRSPEDLGRIADYHGVFAVLIDTWDPLLAGGTGRTCDWGLASLAAAGGRVILAGGLTPANVGEAVRRVRPFGVDVSSGVEAAPGKKDKALMREFARAARDAAGDVQEEVCDDENTSGD
ncbi:MAG: phosphoribosylanthranilate isomerase [Actinomycetota bacterium]